MQLYLTKEEAVRIIKALDAHEPESDEKLKLKKRICDCLEKQQR